MQTRRVFLGSLLATLSMRFDAHAQAAPALTARMGENPVAPGRTIPLLNGVFPATPLRMKLGEKVRLRLANELDTPFSLHWRGVRLPNAFDGVPGLTQKPLAKGQDFDVDFAPPDAGTFLFHPSVRTHAAAHMSASGLLIVEEREPPAVDADIAVLLADMTDADDKPKALANGMAQMGVLELPPNARLRLRIASASTRRMMAVGVDGARAMVAAIDGQPCGLFEPVRSTLPLAPGQRYDVFIDLPDADEREVAIVLRGMSGAADLGQKILRIQTKGEAKAKPADFRGLADNPLMPARIPLEKARRLELTIEGAPGGAWKLNGQLADAVGAKPLLSVKRGSALTIGFQNKSALPQIMHVHGHVMRHMHLFDDGWEPYWRDSVIVPEGRTLRTALVADNPGKWLIESGFSTGDGPVGWFEVT